MTVSLISRTNDALFIRYMIALEAELVEVVDGFVKNSETSIYSAVCIHLSVRFYTF